MLSHLVQIKSLLIALISQHLAKKKKENKQHGLSSENTAIITVWFDLSDPHLVVLVPPSFASSLPHYQTGVCLLSPAVTPPLVPSLHPHLSSSSPSSSGQTGSYSTLSWGLLLQPQQLRVPLTNCSTSLFQTLTSTRMYPASAARPDLPPPCYKFA